MLESGYLYGIRICTTDMITKDAQVRKHKKKRINKKWLKRYGYKCVPDDAKTYMMNGTLFMTKRCYQRLKKHIDSGGKADDFIRFQKCYEELRKMMFWIVILILLGILAAQFNNEPRNYNCYDKSPYKCGNCRKNCKWRYIVKKFEQLEKESE